MTKRLNFDEGLKLFKEASLDELKEKAMQVRYEKNPKKTISFVLDSNPNYTNICHTDCSFCAFFRHKNAKDAYQKSVEEVMKHLELAKKAGLSTVLLQGGHNDELKLDYYVNLVKTARERYPEIHPHFFSAPEIQHCANVSNVSVDQVLQALYDAGQRTLPGAGAEILTERVRKIIAPKKTTTKNWLEIHEKAHNIGFRSTATMMYGHVEDPEDIVMHLLELRNVQDRTHGFTAFIPWSYKKDRTALRRKVKNWAGKDAYLRIIAFSRIFLDNFDHIQASWFSEGKETGIEALHCGADDFGGIILEENVHRAAEFVNRTDHNGILQMIRKAGFEPVQRNPLYEIIRTYEDVSFVEVPKEQQIREKEKLAILH